CSILVIDYTIFLSTYSFFLDHSTVTYVFALSLHDALPILPRQAQLTWKMAEVAAAAPTPIPEVAEMVVWRVIDNAGVALAAINRDRKSTRLNSSHVKSSYAVFCLKKKTR